LCWWFTSPLGPLSTRGEGEKRYPEVPSPYLERGFRGEVKRKKAQPQNPLERGKSIP
jgi:hypothetical protein